MGTGPLNHPGKVRTSNYESSFAKATEDGRRTLNAEFPERGLQSASTFATNECSNKFGERDQASALVGRVTPCAPGADQDLRGFTARTKSGAHGVTRPTFARLSPAAAGQTRLEFSKRGLHWRPAAPGLLPTTAQAPTSKLQAPEKFQTSNTNERARHWSLVLGASLELGAWMLVFARERRPYQSRRGRRALNRPLSIYF